MNSDQIEAKGQVKGPSIDFVCAQLKLLRNPARLPTVKSRAVDRSTI